MRGKGWGGGALYHLFVNFKMYFAVMFRKHSIVTNKKIPSSDCWLQFSFCGHIFFLYPQEHSVLMPFKAVDKTHDVQIPAMYGVLHMNLV